MRRLSLSVVLCFAFLLWGAGTAAAHSQLVGSTPAADSTVDVPLDGVELNFNQDIGEAFANVSVVGPDDKLWSQGTAQVDGSTVRIDIAEALPGGLYTVGYRVTSADGHPITGSYQFFVAASPSSGATTAESNPNSKDAAGVTVSTTPRPAYDPNDPAASEEEQPPKQNIGLLLSIMAAAVLGLGAIAFLLVRRADR